MNALRCTNTNLLKNKKMSSTLLKKLKSLATEIIKTPISRLNEQENVCLIVCNTYSSYRLSLGDGPLNDAISFATSIKSYGFKQYYLHNAHSKIFLKYFDALLEKTSKHLIIYYVGHGTTVADVNKDEDDGSDEAFVFEDSTLIDDILIEHLIDKKNANSRLTLVTDACHSGSIWDIQGGNVNGRSLPQNIMSISASNDKQTAKQTVIDRKEQGIFTMNFVKALKAKPSITPKDLLSTLKKELKKYSQTCTIAMTTKSLNNLPIFS